LVGKIVAPTRLMNADPFPRETSQGALVHLVRNHAWDLVRSHSTHASIESVVVETKQWAERVKKQRVNTVDQELYHVIDAIHSSPRGKETDIYAAVLVTDNVAIDVSANDVTLQAAEETIAASAHLRQKFLFDLFRRQGILTDQVVSGTEPTSRAAQTVR
jgi:hypothetical protein